MKKDFKNKFKRITNNILIGKYFNNRNKDAISFIIFFKNNLL